MFGPLYDVSQCSWLLQCAGGTVPTLSFSQFHTEENFDFVTVDIDGPDTEAANLPSVRLHGSSLPGCVVLHRACTLQPDTTPNDLARLSGLVYGAHAGVTQAPPRR